MSDRERAEQLLNSVPDYKISFVIAYLQGITAGESNLSDIPNAETIAAMKELEEGRGEVFTGSTDDFFKMILEG